MYLVARYVNLKLKPSLPEDRNNSSRCVQYSFYSTAPTRNKKTKIICKQGLGGLSLIILINLNLILAGGSTTTKLNSFHLGYFPIYLSYRCCKFVFS